MHEITKDEIELTVGDGTKMKCHVARPASKGAFPGLMVFQEAFGVNAHIKDVAARYAGEGYVAVAPDLFHRTAPGFQGDYNNFPGVMPHLQALKPETLSADITAVYDYLTGPASTTGNVGAVGFCLGGRCAFLANATVPLKAAISYYGGNIAPALLDKAKDQNGPIILFWGGLDKHIGPEQRAAVAEALKKAKKDFAEVNFSKADHGFFNNDRPAYNPQAAVESWAMATSFFKLHLG